MAIKYLRKKTETRENCVEHISVLCLNKYMFSSQCFSLPSGCSMHSKGATCVQLNKFQHTYFYVPWIQKRESILQYHLVSNNEKWM